MLDKVFTNNQVTIAGEVVSDFTFSHEIYGENFFLVNIAVSRLSDSCDIIPVMLRAIIRDVSYRQAASSDLITDMRRLRTDLFYQFLQERYHLLKFRRENRILTTYSLTDMYVRNRYIEKHLLAER